MSLHNDLHTWAGKAAQRGLDTIEIDRRTIDQIISELVAVIRLRESHKGASEVISKILDRLEPVEGADYAKIDLDDVDWLKLTALSLDGPK